MWCKFVDLIELLPVGAWLLQLEVASYYLRSCSASPVLFKNCESDILRVWMCWNPSPACHSRVNTEVSSLFRARSLSTLILLSTLNTSVSFFKLSNSICNVIFLIRGLPIDLVWKLGQDEELKLLRQWDQWLCQVRTDLKCSKLNIPQLYGWLNVSSR